MIQLSNRRWVVAGIVSWGVRCGTFCLKFSEIPLLIFTHLGERSHPGIYTKVGPYVSWIIENAVF